MTMRDGKKHAKVSIREVAQHANVSTATVSYVINGTKNVALDKRMRVEAAIEELGYHPNWAAQSLRHKSTNTIGVLVEDITGFSVPMITSGISDYLQKCGYQILLSDLNLLESLHNRYDQIVEQRQRINDAISFLLFGKQVDAVIYVGMFDREITGIIDATPKPLVIAYSTTADPGICSVTYDSERISEQAVGYLIDQGHQRIGVITGPADTFPVKMRMQGVRQAFQTAGLVLPDQLVKTGDWEYASGYCRMTELLDADPRPTALFAMNDLMASGAMDAIRDTGLGIPGDISVIGFDNREIASYLRPRLTTIEIDLKQIGRTAAEITLRQIREAPMDRQSHVIPSKLIQRESVARL